MMMRQISSIFAMRKKVSLAVPGGGSIEQGDYICPKTGAIIKRSGSKCDRGDYSSLSTNNSITVMF